MLDSGVILEFEPQDSIMPGNASVLRFCDLTSECPLKINVLRARLMPASACLWASIAILMQTVRTAFKSLTRLCIQVSDKPRHMAVSDGILGAKK